MNKHPISNHGRRLRAIVALAWVLAAGGLSGKAEAASDVRVVAPVGYSIRGSKCTIKASRVYNYAPTGTISAPLHLQLWATKQRYRGHSIPGFKIADLPIGRLKGGYYFSEINRTVRYHRPPRGRYFFTLVLTERGRFASYITFRRSQILRSRSIEP